MMIKVSNEFLEFDELIEMEKQIKLFEDISTTDGDFSYSFELQKTLLNTKLLGNPFPDNISKPVYQQIPAKILSDSGAETYDGYLRVERITEVYHCSFFAGNNNWFARITGLLSDLDLSAYDIEQTRDNIVSSWSNTEGIVFPLVDNGGLLTRSYPQVKVEDLVGGFYVKTIFNKVFAEAGIKIQGELLEDWMYNNIICLRNSKSQEEINLRSIFVNKTNAQTGITTEVNVDFNDDSSFPYFNNGYFNLATEEYTADLKSVVSIEVALSVEGFNVLDAYSIRARVNGVEVDRIPYQPLAAGIFPANATIKTTLEAGDVLEITIESVFTIDVLSGTLKITPTFLYKTFGNAAVPNWTKQDFVSNILRLFNVLASYHEGTSTLTLNIFEKIKSKPAIDLSEYISETEVDYSDFISDYGKKSTFSYNEVDFNELKDYNVGQFFKYGQGVIDVDNDFLENIQTVIESDFSNPIAYVNGVLDMSLERTNLLELDEGENTEVASVTDASGNARFNIADDIFLIGDLVRLTDSSNKVYNGDWVVTNVSAGWVEFLGTPFATDATLTATKLDYVYGNSNDVFLFVNVPDYSLPKFSGRDFIYLEGNSENNWAVSYFDLINTNRQINADFIYSLSFGGIDDPLHYQTTMIEQYFRLFGRVLNDPVKLLSTATLPYDVFNRIDFLSPITIKTIESSNSYYLNRISGYKESYYSCLCELIKLP
jgi:hypothetical protein